MNTGAYNPKFFAVFCLLNAYVVAESAAAIGLGGEGVSLWSNTGSRGASFGGITVTFASASIRDTAIKCLA